ncbi:TIGR00645 family protein [Amycolatopsis sp. 195334CR]|uniref:TIGR00645 family protein n=1 Tax=Amycolatopsis sp. 195334CR TaxID=2814588 RepID=UPI0027DE6196|nr:TIGR00645 family protein [Amycolatopsis sp. 195334CR]
MGRLLFFSRWLQVPLYLGLIVAQLVYVWRFLVETWHLVTRALTGATEGGAVFTEGDVMLAVLQLVDIVMISNLLIMVIVGGYETFVSRIRLRGHPDEPQWLSHVNPNVLKTKLATAIIGISSVHLLRTFIQPARIPETGQVDTQAVMWQAILHALFVLSAIGLASIDRIMGHAEPGGHTPVPAQRVHPAEAEPVNSRS